jgi:hypothetical protein
MRWQTTLALAIILIAVGAFYYVFEIRLGPEREKAEGRKGRVFSAEPADVTEVVVARPSDTLRLKREGTGWQLLEPVKARADQSAADGLVTTVTQAKSDREIDPAPKSPADFGLDKPAATVTLVLKDGKQVGLALGGKNPTGVWVYARETDKPPVMALGESVLRDAIRPVAEFRDKTVLAFDRKDVTGVEVVTRDETIAVAAADGKWKLTKPSALRADTDTMREFLDKLQAGRVKEFVAEAPPKLDGYGLDRPVRVSIDTGKDKDRATRTLLFGRVDDQKKGVYAMRGGETSVLLIPEDVWTAVPKTAAAVRDKTVVTFDREKVTRIELESPKGAVTLAKENDRWKITRPETLPADQTEAGGVLFKLQELKAQAFLSEDASGLARFLAKPEVKVTIAQQGDAAPKTLLLAPSSERRGGQPSAYAGITGSGPVALVDGKAIADLSRTVMDLRDRTLVSNLEVKDVKRVRVKSGSQTMLLERSSDTEWKVLEPKKGSAKSAKVEDLLYALRGLRWKEIATPDGQEPAKYGLDSPTFELTLYRTDGTEIATVLLGKREAERGFVKTKSSPAIYGFDPKQLEVPKVDDLQG